MHAMLLAATLMAVVAQTPAAQPPAQPSSQPGVTSLPAPEGSAAPFKKLFLPETALREAQMQAARSHARAALEARTGQAAVAPKVVCGMVVIQADPNVDPRMIRRPPPDAATAAHIKRIAPTACAE